MSKVFLILAACSILCACASPYEVDNYRTYTDDRGTFYIYDGVIDRAALISGVGMGQTRVIITRAGNQ